MSFYKVLVIGDTGVGKTSLTNKIVFNNFSEKYKATIGCEFGLKILSINGESCRIQLWDLAGQDRLGGISRLYCKDASGALVVGDITNTDSLQTADLWKKSVDDLLSENIPMVLCLNKCDREDAHEYTQDELKKMGQGYTGVFMTSAKDGTNAELALSTLAQHIVSNKPLQPPTAPRKDPGIVLTKQKPSKQKKCCK